jgi:hypothetical protein
MLNFEILYWESTLCLNDLRIANIMKSDCIINHVKINGELIFIEGKGENK